MDQWTEFEGKEGWTVINHNNQPEHMLFQTWILSEDVVLAVRTVLSLLSETTHLIGQNSAVQLRAWACFQRIVLISIHFEFFFAKSTELWDPFLYANLFMGSSFSFPKNHAIHTDLELLTSDGKKNHYNLWNGRYENCLGNLKFILSKIRTFVRWLLKKFIIYIQCQCVKTSNVGVEKIYL